MKKLVLLNESDPSCAAELIGEYISVADHAAELQRVREEMKKEFDQQRRLNTFPVDTQITIMGHPLSTLVRFLGEVQMYTAKTVEEWYKYHAERIESTLRFMVRNGFLPIDDLTDDERNRAMINGGNPIKTLVDFIERRNEKFRENVKR